MQADRSKTNYLSIPNILTYTRILAGLLFIAAIFRSFSLPLLVAVYLSVLVSDRLDGFLARRWHMESKFGERIETVADTFFTLSIILFGVSTLGMPLPIIGLFVGLFILGLVAQMWVYSKWKKWFSESLWPSKISALITYTAGFFYLVDLPYKYAAIIVAVCFAAAASGYYLYRLDKFARF
ncbi:MAG: CDP-alcohol phosphatidyltransferase family protein [Candidatus Kerfeldbacteria bacterium]